MPLSLATEIKVIGNICEEYAARRRKLIKFFNFKPIQLKGYKQFQCTECSEYMSVPMNFYNGYSEVDDDGIAWRCFEYECKNYHNFSWRELQISENTKEQHQMLYSDIINDIVAGKYATRPEWEARGEYLALLPGMIHIWKISTQPGPQAAAWLPLLVDLLADDWRVMEKLPEPQKPADAPQA